MIDKSMPPLRFGRSRAFLPIVLAALAGAVVAREEVARTEHTKTRFGPVSFGLTGEIWPGTAFIRFKGKPLLEPVDNWGISLIGQYALPDGDVLIFDIMGGTACLHQKRLLKIDRRGRAALSDYFGACGDTKIRRDEDGLVIETLGACHAIDDDEEQRACDESLRQDYSWRGGRLEEIPHGE